MIYFTTIKNLHRLKIDADVLFYKFYTLSLIKIK